MTIFGQYRVGDRIIDGAGNPVRVEVIRRASLPSVRDEIRCCVENIRAGENLDRLIRYRPDRADELALRRHHRVLLRAILTELWARRHES